MTNEVYANMMEVSCKAAAGKSICAFPDVCMTPPQTPATPPGVPIPYPNTGMASDCTEGSSSVKISGKEVMLKNKSYFKKSTGDEAGCAPMKGVITHKNMGKVYFTMWSMDVKIEGENVVRHLDLTTHNHASAPGNSPPWTYMDAMVLATASSKCQEQSEKTQKCVERHVKKNTHQEKRRAHNRPGTTKVSAQTDDANVDWSALLKEDEGKHAFYNKKAVAESMCADDGAGGCKQQFNCNLLPFDFGCCDKKTAHHVVPVHCFLPSGERKNDSGSRYPGAEMYDHTNAPCICLDGARKSSVDDQSMLMQHGRVHQILDVLEDSHMQVSVLVGPRGGKTIYKEAGTWNFEQANSAGARSVFEVTGCDEECLKKQSEAAHKQMGLDVGAFKSDKFLLRADSSGGHTPEGFVPGGSISIPHSG